MNSKLIIFSSIISASLIFAGVSESYSLEGIEGTHAEINFSFKIGEERYLISYYVCSDQKTIESPKILILTDSDTTEVTSTKILWAGSCQIFESKITAKNLSSTTFIITD